MIMLAYVQSFLVSGGCKETGSNYKTIRIDQQHYFIHDVISKRVTHGFKTVASSKPPHEIITDSSPKHPKTLFVG